MRVAITGAFGYTGRYVAERHLARGDEVVTLTNHPRGSSIAEREVEVQRLAFDVPAELERSLKGAELLYNTYWVRFPHGSTTFERAVHNSRVLIDAAAAAGVRRVVHVSIANPSHDSSNEYYRGKAEVEDHLRSAGIEYAIVRPTVLFGRSDVLVNNIAWFLRHSPVFGIPGDGGYGIQPVFIDDYADLLVHGGLAGAGESVVDAVGPEVYTFRRFVMTIRAHVRSGARVVGLPPAWARLGGALFGLFLRDVVLTSDEIATLIEGRLVSHDEPTCPTGFSGWLAERADELGRVYASELGRHYR